MFIRSYQPGDEQAQARIYNMAAGSLPGFKPATAEEIARRYQAADFDPQSRYYAALNDHVVGYAGFGPNGRISYPWCFPDAQAARQPLLDAVLDQMRRHGVPEAWAAYRADWTNVLEFLHEHGFIEKRVMINYVTECSRLPAREQLPSNRAIEPLLREDLPRLIALVPELFAGSDAHSLKRYFWGNPFYSFPESLFGLKNTKSGELLGVYVLVADDRFADPTRIDAAMPCFRLGAFGTERERHKRVNGLFSCVFAGKPEGELLLSAHLLSQASRSGLTHLAAQAPSDARMICALYDLYFQRQGAFPILGRSLAP